MLVKGGTSQSGSPRDLYDRPETRFAASFIDPSNRRETVVRGSGNLVRIDWGSVDLAVRGPLLPVPERRSPGPSRAMRYPVGRIASMGE